MLRFILPTLALGLTATGADAALVTYNFAGTITSSYVSGTAATFTGSFSYDTAVNASTCASYGGPYCYYPALRNISFTSGSIGSTASSAGAGQSFIVEDNITVDPIYGYGSNKVDELFMEISSGGGVNSISNGFQALDVVFDDNRATAFNSAAIPQTLSLNSFTSTKFAAARADGRIEGTITSLSVAETSSTPALPEPATWAMMIAGFGLVGGAMRRRNTIILA